MKQQIIALGLGIIGALLHPSPQAHAQDPSRCGARDRMVAGLAEAYGETRQSLGLGANDSVVELFASTETGTWTITVTLPNGLTCLVASGRAYEAVREALEPAGAAL